MKRSLLLALCILGLLNLVSCNVFAQNSKGKEFNDSKVITVKGSSYNYSVDRYATSIHDVSDFRTTVEIPTPETLKTAIDVPSFKPRIPGHVQFCVSKLDIEKELVPDIIACFSKKERQILQEELATIKFENVVVDDEGKILELEMYLYKKDSKQSRAPITSIDPEHMIKALQLVKERLTFEDGGRMKLLQLPYMYPFDWYLSFNADNTIKVECVHFIPSMERLKQNGFTIEEWIEDLKELLKNPPAKREIPEGEEWFPYLG